MLETIEIHTLSLNPAQALGFNKRNFISFRGCWVLIRPLSWRHDTLRKLYTVSVIWAFGIINHSREKPRLCKCHYIYSCGLSTYPPSLTLHCIRTPLCVPDHKVEAPIFSIHCISTSTRARIHSMSVDKDVLFHFINCHD